MMVLTNELIVLAGCRVLRDSDIELSEENIKVLSKRAACRRSQHVVSNISHHETY